MDHIVVNGRLDVIDASGRREKFGVGENPDFIIRLHRRGTPWRIAINPQLAIGEAYKNGDLTLEEGSVYDFLVFMADNIAQSGPSRLMRVRERCGFLVRQLMQRNVGLRSQSNVAHHYDLTEELYDIVRDSLGLEPIRKAASKGSKITESINKLK